MFPEVHSGFNRVVFTKKIIQVVKDVPKEGWRERNQVISLPKIMRGYTGPSRGSKIFVSTGVHTFFKGFNF